MVRRLSTYACCCAVLAGATACQRRSPPPTSSPDALLFRIEAAPNGGGSRKAWIATHQAGGRTARFRVELVLEDSRSSTPFAFTKGALVREPGSDGTQLMHDLARALGGVKPPVGSTGVERLEFEAALLGRDLSRGRGADQYAGMFTSSPKGTWIATKVFLADGEGEVFLNLDPVGGWGEFATKDTDYANEVLRELGRVFEGAAVAESNITPAKVPTPAQPSASPRDALAPLRAQFHETEPARRASALVQLRKLPDADRMAALPDVVTLAEDASVVVRTAALAALPELGGAPELARAVATKALRHSHPHTQVMAARAIWKLGEPTPAVAHLIAFLGGEARADAALVLREIGPEARSAVPQLTRLLEERRNANEGYAAAVALGAMGSAAESALPALEAAARDPDRTVSQAARYALDSIQAR